MELAPVEKRVPGCCVVCNTITAILVLYYLLVAFLKNKIRLKLAIFTGPLYNIVVTVAGGRHVRAPAHSIGMTASVHAGRRQWWSHALWLVPFSFRWPSLTLESRTRCGTGDRTPTRTENLIILINNWAFLLCAD